MAAFSLAGVMGNKHLAGTVKNANRWKALELELKGTVQPSAGIVILTYETNATRANGESHDALVRTGYVRRATEAVAPVLTTKAVASNGYSSSAREIPACIW